MVARLSRTCGWEQWTVGQLAHVTLSDMLDCLLQRIWGRTFHVPILLCGSLSFSVSVSDECPVQNAEVARRCVVVEVSPCPDAWRRMMTVGRGGILVALT